MEPTTARKLFGILFVALAIAVAATLGTTLAFSGIFCDPAFAPMVLLRWFVFFAVSVGGPVVFVVIVALLGVWRFQHTFLLTIWTRRIFAAILCLALIGGAAPPFFIYPQARHVCR